MSRVEIKVEVPEQSERAGCAPLPTAPVLTRVLALGAVIGLVSIVFFEARSLWTEWNLLQGEIRTIRQTQIVGYRDISPSSCTAECPREWFRDSDGQSQLWSRWEQGVGHRWFRFGHGELEQGRLIRPDTGFVTHAIDFPSVETDGGEIWQRIPMEAFVVGETLLGVKCVYPVLVLDKVQVINDLVQDHPYLIAFNSFASPRDAVSIFDSAIEGRRLTMAATGYFHNGKPLLYDRGSESLWSEEGEAMKALAGKLRGVQLRRVAQPDVVTWKSWLAQNQRSRLLVGADRSRGIPRE